MSWIKLNQKEFQMSQISSIFHLAGLTCEACEKLVTKKLNGINGVTEVSVSSKTGTAKILADHSLTPTEITTALKTTHYSLVK